MKGYEDVPLFPSPPTTTPELSRVYDGSRYRAHRDRPPKYTPIKTTTAVDCDECFARQHETAGACGPRAAAKVRRMVGVYRLDLCRGHEELWKSRDASVLRTD